MKKVKSKLVIAVILMFGIVSFISCTQDDIDHVGGTGYGEESVWTQNNFEENIHAVDKTMAENVRFVDSFLNNAQQSNLDKSSILKMLKILNVSIHTNVYDLSNSDVLDADIDISDENNTQTKNSNFKTYNLSCDKLVKIRDIMLSEFDKDQDKVCWSASVVLSYWYKSRKC